MNRIFFCGHEFIIFLNLQRIALRRLVDLEGDPRIVEEGKKAVEMALLAGKICMYT